MSFHRLVIFDIRKTILDETQPALSYLLHGCATLRNPEEKSPEHQHLYARQLARCTLRPEYQHIYPLLKKKKIGLAGFSDLGPIEVDGLKRNLFDRNLDLHVYSQNFLGANRSFGFYSPPSVLVVSPNQEVIETARKLSYDTATNPKELESKLR